MKTHLGVGKTESAMKKFMTVLSVVLMAAGFVSCKKEINVYGPAPEKGELKVRFIADASLTKVGLTPDENDENFSAVWDKDDYIGIVCTDKNDSKVSKDEILACWVPSANTSTPGYFETFLDATSLTEENAPYSFVGYWPEGKTATELFPDRRKQNGDKYNGNYDIMISDKTAVDFSVTESNAVTVVLPMKRQTSIAYFHITSELNEQIVSATLTTGEGEFIAATEANLTADGFSIVDGCGKNSITLLIDGEMSSQDFRLWFNVLPVNYTSMKLVVETENHSFTMSKKAAGSWKAGELNSVVIGIVPADKWAVKETPSEPVEKTLSIADYASANNWLNATQYLSIDIDENLTVKCAGRSDTGKYYSNGKTWRMYQNENSKVTFTLSDGYKFQDAKIIYEVGNAGSLVYNGTNVESNTSLNVTDKTSFEFGVGNTTEATNGNIQITSIYVKYIKSGSGSFDPANPNYAISVVGNIVGGTVTPSRSYAKETEKFTVTCEPSIGYEYVSESLVVKNAVTGENLVADDNGEYTMPAANVTVTASFSKIAYKINTSSNDRGTISVKIGGSEVTEANYGDEITLSATPAQGYEFINWSVTDNDDNVVEVKDGKFTMPASPVTVNAYFLSSTTYTASFSVNGSIISTQTCKENDKIVFPENPTIDGVDFMGWTTTAINAPQQDAPDCVSTAVMGRDDITFYAVFATKYGTEATEVLGQTLAYDTWTYSGSTTDKSSYRLFHKDSYIESAKFDLSKLSKVIVYGGTFGGTDYNSLTIGDETNTWKSVIVSGNSETKANTYTNGTPLTGTGKLRITSNSGTSSDKGVRISKVEIYITKGGYYYDDYCTNVVTLSSIAISGSPTKTEYTEGEEFNPSGLTVTGTYSNGKSKVISTGIIWTSNPNPLTEGTTSVTVTATVGSISSAGYVVTGLTVTAGSGSGETDWSKTYKSNVVISGAEVKIGDKTYDAIQVGTSKSSGSQTFKVPANTTKLYLHVVGWNGENNKTHTIKTSVGTISSSSIQTTADSGASNKSPFTLSSNDYSSSKYFYEFTLSGVTSEATITISNSAGKSRGVYFGINAE